MGMYDEIEIHLPLPGLPSKFKPTFQTKSFDHPSLDDYRITKEGILEHRDYRIEDRSDPTKTGLLRFAGSMTKVHTGWSKVDFTGEVRFYDIGPDEEWLEYSVYLVHGVLTTNPHRIE